MPEIPKGQFLLYVITKFLSLNKSTFIIRNFRYVFGISELKKGAQTRNPGVNMAKEKKERKKTPLN